MRRLLAALWLLLALPVAAASFPVTATDALGRSVTVRATPRRIVSLSPNVTEMLFALDLDQCDYPPAATRKPKVGGYATMSVERIIALRPDLVIAARGVPMPVVKALDKAHVLLYTIDPKSVSQVLSAIRAIGRVTGATAPATRVASSMQRRIDVVTRRVGATPVSQRPRVYFQLWDNPPWSAGPGSYAADLIARAGGANIAHDLRGFRPFSAEALVARDPQVVILASMGAGYEAEARAFSRRYPTLAAVKSGRVFVINQDLINRPGPRVVEALEQIADRLHPR
jgi:iron complex transport system substrate-binding protein